MHSAKVLAVAPNSAAAGAGLRTDDEILLAKSVGETLRMRVKHSGGETYAVVMSAVRKPDAGNN